MGEIRGGRPPELFELLGGGGRLNAARSALEERASRSLLLDCRRPTSLRPLQSFDRLGSTHAPATTPATPLASARPRLGLRLYPPRLRLRANACRDVPREVAAFEVLPRRHVAEAADAIRRRQSAVVGAGAGHPRPQPVAVVLIDPVGQIVARVAAQLELCVRPRHVPPLTERAEVRGCLDAVSKDGPRRPELIVGVERHAALNDARVVIVGGHRSVWWWDGG